MQPLIINAALTGMVPMKHDTPHVPISPSEIIADAKRCRDAGATIVHLHAREADGTPACQKEIYAEIFEGVRSECPELLISGSCSGRATPDNLCTMVRALPPQTTWSATGVGRFQFFINSLAVTMGGHVRVGLEDSIYYDADRRHLATNAGLIDRIVRLARAAGREIATADQARYLIGIEPPSLPLRLSA